MKPKTASCLFAGAVIEWFDLELSAEAKTGKVMNVQTY